MKKEFLKTINLNRNEELNSPKTNKSYTFSCFIKDNMFQIEAEDLDETYLI